jgi:hypothetical protein
LERLVRRADFLEKRIREAPPAKDVGHDSSELSALRWAIDVIRRVGVLEEETRSTSQEGPMRAATNEVPDTLRWT